MLRIEIKSFSYRDGIPASPGEHGGGFVFDCRCLPNPGRDPAYKDLTGRHHRVATYLRQQPEVEQFWREVQSLIDLATANYQGRGFCDLAVYFGCTGGQHRSVYFAERLSKYLGQRGLEVSLEHVRARRSPELFQQEVE